MLWVKFSQNFPIKLSKSEILMSWNPLSRNFWRRSTKESAEFVSRFLIFRDNNNFLLIKQFIELYPTVIRALAVGAFGVIERIGGAIGPQLINMNRSVWPHSSITITTLVLLSSLVAGYIILPETRDQSMPDVLEQTNFKCRRNREKWHKIILL